MDTDRVQPITRRTGERLLNAATIVAVVIAMALAGMSFRTLATRRGQGTPPPRREPELVAGADSIFAPGLVLMAATQPADTVQVTVFSDFQCPYCRDLAGYLERRRPSLGHTAIRFRQLPLTGLHPFAYDAALASFCAADQKRFAALHDLMFQRQEELGRASWTALASDAGVKDTTQFARCMRERTHADELERDRRVAAALGIAGTPATIIGDRLVRGFPGEAYMDSVLALAPVRTVRR